MNFGRFSMLQYYLCTSVELRGGKAPWEGNIFVDGQPVCDDTYTGEEIATVVCR